MCRNATNYFPGADDGEGATIADLLAEEEVSTCALLSPLSCNIWVILG
jgi:hypothetical protein